MAHAFAEITFTDAVKAAQEIDGSRARYARAFEADDTRTHYRLGARERAFIARQRSISIATVSADGWPYVQHRGGAPGFLQVLDERTIAFADVAGNRQMVTVGNVAGNDRVALLLIDYAERTRMKILGRLRISALSRDAALAAGWINADDPATVQRAMVIDVHAFDWNCPQRIPQRLEAEDVARILAEREARIALLESRLAALEPHRGAS